MKSIISYVALLVFTSACASSLHGRKRAAMGASIGGATGAFGGYALSPTKEDRGLNTLVFGLTGALVGGLFALFTDEVKDAPVVSDPSLITGKKSNSTNEFTVPVQNTDQLPEFLKHRIRPAVIEEYIERDQLTEDGALREPHKVYRIKQPTELVTSPKVDTEKKK